MLIGSECSSVVTDGVSSFISIFVEFSSVVSGALEAVVGVSEITVVVGDSSVSAVFVVVVFSIVVVGVAVVVVATGMDVLEVPPHEVASKEIAKIEIIFFTVKALQVVCLILVVFNCFLDSCHSVFGSGD
jgi:hypothetical protein